MNSHRRKQSSKSTNRVVRRTRKRSGRSVDYGSLEPRLVLTTFLVNTTIDDATGVPDGQISLREAIIAANTNTAFGDAPAGSADGDRIRFDASIANSTITLSNGQLEILDDLAIQGGNSGITVDGNGDRIFRVSTNERVSFGKLALTGGSAAIGGAIGSFGGGNTIVFGVNFSSNTATGLGGGAIYHEVGNLYITDSNFDQNMASGASGSGGAILSATGVTAISGGMMTANVANRAGGAIELINGSFFSRNLTVGQTGEGNIAGPVGEANPGNGGGLHVTGTADTVIIDGEFIDNYAAREGGGLWNQAGATMIIRGTTISENVAAGNEADDGGGGVFNNSGTLRIVNAKIGNNEANGTSGSGGGIFSTDGNVRINSSEIFANSANRAGGGIEVIDGEVVIVSSELGGDDSASGNVAGPDGSAAPGNGGAVHVSGADARVVVRSSTVSNNVAASEGGGLWNQAGSLLRVDSGSVVDANTASGNAADNGGGGIFNNGGQVVIDNSTVSNNRADGDNGSGGGIFSTDGNVLVFNSTVSGNAAARAGGGIEMINGYTLLRDSMLTGNDAGITFTATPGSGGGLHISGTSGTAAFRNSTIANNQANLQGGGLWNQQGSKLVVNNNSEVNNNSAAGTDGVGGGIYNKGELFVLDSVFSMNSSTDSGGGIFQTDSATGNIFDSEFGGNLAGADGGGIFNDGFARVNSSDFNSNVATNSGGAIFTGSGATTISNNNTFLGNLPNDQN